MGLKRKRIKSIVMLTLFLSSIIAPASFANNNNNNNVEIISSINKGNNLYEGEYFIDNTIVKYKADKNNNIIYQELEDSSTGKKTNIVYDINNDILTIGDVLLEMNTTVESFDSSIYSSKEEALNAHKDALMNEYLLSVNQEDGSSLNRN